MKKILFIALSCICLLQATANVHIQAQPDGKMYAGVVVSGSVSAKYNIVFLGDGFTATDQALFNAKVIEAVNALRNTEPYKSYMCSFNIWRVNVISSESGIDHPVSNIFKNTELDCSFGNPALKQAERCITSGSPAKCFEAAGYAPAYNAVFILANDTEWGGCESDLVCSSIAPGFAGIVTHELGHKISSLADEYTCYVCDGSDNGTAYTGNEPTQVNLTKDKVLAGLKWGGLVLIGTPIPTLTNVPPGVVGLFAGGGYFAQGIYRPEWTCLMQTTASPFCAVCRNEMARKLNTYCLHRFKGPALIRERVFWKIPACLSCPPDIDLKTMIVLPEQEQSHYQYELVNSQQQVVTAGKTTADKWEAEFNEHQGETYFIRVTPLAVTNQTLTPLRFNPSLFRNGKLAILE